MAGLIIFASSLACGLWGLYRLVEGGEHSWERRVNGTACLALLVAGFSGGRELVQSKGNGAHWNATELTGTERKQAWESHLAERVRSATEQIATREGRTERKQTERFQAVVNEIGPPPAPNAVPVLGYVGKNGKRTSSAWVTRPDGNEENNLVRSVR